MGASVGTGCCRSVEQGMSKSTWVVLRSRSCQHTHTHREAGAILLRGVHESAEGLVRTVNAAECEAFQIQESTQPKYRTVQLLCRVGSTPPESSSTTPPKTTTETETETS